MYVNNIEPEMFLPPGSESFNHNATRTTSSRSRSNNVNNNIVPVYWHNGSMKFSIKLMYACLTINLPFYKLILCLAIENLKYIQI